MTAPTRVATAFARWATDLQAADVPGDVRHSLGLRLADSIGLVAAAWGTPPGSAVRQVAEQLGGSGARLLFDPGPLSPAATALAHGTMVHALDYDDTFPTSVVHPSSVLFAAAWAAATDDTPADRVLVAVAAGDELLARVGGLAGRGLHARGFQATGIFGPLGAALVAGIVRGREPDTIAAAMGLAGSMSGGLLEFLSDGTWSKRLHPGWSAHGGIVADDLAAAGFPGPASVLEGRHGLFASFLDRVVDADTVVADLGRTWQSREVELKLFPCAHVIHPFLELVLGQRSAGVSAADVESIVCGVAPWYVPIVCEPRAEKLDPTGEYQARTSLPVSVALALVDGRVDDLSYADASVARPEVRALARRISHVEDPALTTGFGATMRLDLRDGRRIDAQPPASTDVPERVRAKFRTSMSRLAPADADDRVEQLWRLAVDLGSAPWKELRAAASAVSPPGAR